MAWAKLTSKTLTGTDNTITTDTFTGKKFIQVLIHEFTGTTGDYGMMQLSGDGTGVYANRYSRNGGGDNTKISDDNMLLDSSDESNAGFYVNYLCGITGEEKLQIGFACLFSTAGAGTAPTRMETVNKFVPSPDVDITSILYDSNNDTKTCLIDSNISALGTD